MTGIALEEEEMKEVIKNLGEKEKSKKKGVAEKEMKNEEKEMKECDTKAKCVIEEILPKKKKEKDLSKMTLPRSERMMTINSRSIFLRETTYLMGRKKSKKLTEQKTQV
jgi:hypothetical protein